MESVEIILMERLQQLIYNREVKEGRSEVSAVDQKESHWPSRRTNYNAPSLKRGGVSLAPTDWILFFVHGVGGSSEDWNQQVSQMQLYMLIKLINTVRVYDEDIFRHLHLLRMS